MNIFGIARRAFANLINSNQSGLMRIESLKNDGTTATQRGNWIQSATNSSAGVYVYNIQPGIFSEAPHIIVCTGHGAGTSDGREATVAQAAATPLTFTVRTSSASSGGVVNISHNVLAIGPSVDK
jgi:hypothetical protein